MTKQEAKKKHDEAVKLREQLDAEIVERIAEVDLLEGGLKSRRNDKDRVTDPESPKYIEDPVKRKARVEKLKAEIDERIKRRKVVKAEIHKLRPRLAKATKAAKKWARKLRNYIKPKVYDLGMDKGAVRPLYPMGAITLAIGHYTAGPLADDRDEAIQLWRQYDAYHKSLGWACIGYNVGIDPEGGIALLRGPGHTGAHTLNYNSNHLGISAHGTTGDKLNANQCRALRTVRKKWAKGRDCIGHRQAPGQSTSCPGDMLGQYNSWGKKG